MDVTGRNDTIQDLENLFNDWYTPVLRYCATIVRDIAVAEDIVQQAFITLWNKRNEKVVITSPKAWLYKTVYHGALDYLKHEGIKKKYRAETLNVTVVQEPRDKASESELLDRIRKAVEELPTECRRIFVMSRDRQLKYTEIAAALNISEKTVENQMGKALKLLREALKEYLLPLLFLIVTR